MVAPAATVKPSAGEAVLVMVRSGVGGTTWWPVQSKLSGSVAGPASVPSPTKAQARSGSSPSSFASAMTLAGSTYVPLSTVPLVALTVVATVTVRHSLEAMLAAVQLISGAVVSAHVTPVPGVTEVRERPAPMVSRGGTLEAAPPGEP